MKPRTSALEVAAQGQRKGNFTDRNRGRLATGRPFHFFSSEVEFRSSSILETSLSGKVLPLEPAIDSSARPNVCNEENRRVNRENYPDWRRPQGFREAWVTWLCRDRVQLGYNPGLGRTIERGQIFCSRIAEFYPQRQSFIEPGLYRQPGPALSRCLPERKWRLLLQFSGSRRTNLPNPKFPLDAGQENANFRR